MNKKITGFVGSALMFSVLTVTAQNLFNPATEAKINALIKKMTLEEKVGMLHANSSFTSAGVKRLGIPEMVTSDGPHGVRLEHGRGWTPLKNVNDAGTYLPTGNTLAATWNPKLGYDFGAVLGSEAKFRGKDVILGPGINIIRSPLNGRNFEYQSEDPYLVAQMAVGYIKGVQDQGVSASLKHFAANNEEVDRGTVNVEMSERALREIYLPGFEAAVKKGQVNTVMGAYNKFRGQYATENKYLINDILKGEWGFKGLVMSDWGAVHNTMEALENGTDLEMGSDLGTPPLKYSQFFLGDTVITLVKNGKVPVALIDDKVRRILRVMFKTNMIGAKRTAGAYNTKAHQQTALKVAEEGIVLLKNEDNVLPLAKGKIKSIAIIGQNADRENAMGGGSSQVKAKYEITPLQGIKNLLGSSVNVQYAQGYKIARKQQADSALINEAVKIAANADAAIIFCGWTHGYDYTKWDDNAYDAEGVDKPDMDMPFGQNELIKVVLKANPKTIIVLMGGGPIDMREWVGKSKAIIEGWYPGMEGGTALAKVIFGEVNPSGKLPMTFPKKLQDSPAHKLGEFPGVNGVVHYKEDIFVGYRYFDTYKVEPQFAFGHGLSYTTFNYENAAIQRTGEKQVTASVTLKNTGKRDGAEVVQFYVEPINPSVPRPRKELKGFEKVFLKAGETKTIKVILNKDAFSYYDDKKKTWVADNGEYLIAIGNSSKDIQVSRTLLL
ncbi:glycosyl hydrolase [Pedobacter psychrodurus]|uniref:Glycosyl hydrolase n=1 Tax=Pedobacter psychrodurus TaxID=2530456 RepID=A0A4R0Q4E0_9SPHI|nr:glycoside hydrolase family 3 C-terminal domain-containing protein [Pedobacter psychrodurus]TCD28548.1 glycosyl hydrolase [Pedobacter psychrodurus]